MQKHSTRHSLKFRTTFAHPVAHILALAHEWDLLPTWNRFTLEAVKLAEPSIFESYVYGAQKAIYPFKPFQTLLHARGYDLADSHRCLLILVKDADADKLPEGHAPLPKGMAKRRRVNMLPGTCVMLRPLPVGDDGGQRTEALMIAHMDPHIPYVPAALVNFVLGFLAPYIFKQMGSMLDNKFSDPEGIFPQRIAQQPELYGMVDKRMEDFKDELGLERAVSRQGSGRAAGDEQ